MPHADFKDNVATHLLTCLSPNIYGDAGMFQTWQQGSESHNGKEWFPASRCAHKTSVWHSKCHRLNTTMVMTQRYKGPWMRGLPCHVDMALPQVVWGRTAKAGGRHLEGRAPGKTV